MDKPEFKAVHKIWLYPKRIDRMHANRLFVVFLAVATVGSAIYAQDREKTPALYLNEDGQYRIAFPKEPSVSTKKLATVVGAVPITTAKLEVKRGVIFSVTVTTYPESFKDIKPAKVLDGVRDGMKGTDGTISSEKTLSIGTDRWPGREIMIESGSNAVRSYVYLVQNRLYQIQVAGTKDGVNSPSSSEFLSSFDLVPGK